MRENVVRGPLWFLGIGMNGRRPQFKDDKTREALAYAFDWEWTNKNIFHDMYERYTAKNYAHHFYFLLLSSMMVVVQRVVVLAVLI